ncbi:hypothetical protein [Oceanospirillum sediminis]|uniref:Uncharacterized protein n=1 Tax=Oceanospirillum sediminis TaxID=2760088 RepID=A0A839IMJ9_9GAMM|nr:hypothetical protein [Oceanospirillum sediminis]MBB1485697.1 hypothetical protein [Oceanospirillum sediminis]
MSNQEYFIGLKESLSLLRQAYSQQNRIEGQEMFQSLYALVMVYIVILQLLSSF